MYWWLRNSVIQWFSEIFSDFEIWVVPKTNASFGFQIPNRFTIFNLQGSSIGWATVSLMRQCPHAPLMTGYQYQSCGFGFRGDKIRKIQQPEFELISKLHPNDIVLSRISGASRCSLIATCINKLLGASKINESDYFVSPASSRSFLTVSSSDLQNWKKWFSSLISSSWM